ncbi:MAG: UDP-N-acetylmuramoyl-L-alanyl-D-glutamate--2,6-diaminopimelate ligase [Luminiphilus sp.]|nr:UDP-N-acetylmuramoyl-L-alanyl-D-glutamate--2,6-diaminopimelate ligase [Luminiphilus sp.]
MTILPASAPGIDELLAVLPHQVRRAGQMTLDSRWIERGDVFVALPGLEHDGRDFISGALDKGAAAVFAEADGYSGTDERVVAVPGLDDLLPGLVKGFYNDPSQSMQLAAVTGTNGKTSVVELTAQLLRLLGKRAGCIGTLGARLDYPPAAVTNTTPDLISITRQLAAWRQQDVRHVAMEASSHALDQGRLRGLSLHTAVFTNLTRDHLDYHVSERAYADAKLSLFSNFELRRAVFNADDPIACEVADIVGDSAIGISMEDGRGDVRIALRSQRPMIIDIESPWGSAVLEIPLSGRFNAFNVTAAIVTAVGLGFDFDRSCAAVGELLPVAGRMERSMTPEGVLVVVDYAHTPDALENALAALQPETAGLLWVVFGCGGDRDPGKRSLMGGAAQRWADRMVVTSDNPRGESPEAIIDDIVQGCQTRVEMEPDRAAAIRYALGAARAGDTLLIAGKGHEDYQEIKGQRLPFSDRQVVKELLAASGVAV